MSPWRQGSDIVDRLIAAGDVERRQHADAATQTLITRGAQMLQSAQELLD